MYNELLLSNQYSSRIYLYLSHTIIINIIIVISIYLPLDSIIKNNKLFILYSSIVYTTVVAILINKLDYSLLLVFIYSLINSYIYIKTSNIIITSIVKTIYIIMLLTIYFIN